jgi:predicted RecA/RadA family phage recombinase
VGQKSEYWKLAQKPLLRLSSQQGWIFTSTILKLPKLDAFGLKGKSIYWDASPPAKNSISG